MKNERLQGDNSPGRIMVSRFCPSPHCHLSIYQVFKVICRTRYQTDEQTKQRLHAYPFVLLKYFSKFVRCTLFINIFALKSLTLTQQNSQLFFSSTSLAHFV